jgi:uncharacterized protein YbjT (DUF2867 family)
MNYVITGSIGHISKPLTQQLVAAGHTVTVITSNAERVAKIEELGAKALVGSVDDAGFLESAFTGADAVYLMIPPKPNVEGDWYTYQTKVADNYINALVKNNIKNAVVLSSIGAHLRRGAGPIDGVGYLESKLDELTDVNAVYLRPSYFFYNLLAQIGMIKHMGIMGGNFSGNLVLVDPSDIANVAAEKIQNIGTGKEVVYISGDERPVSEIASVIGNAIGKPDLAWVEFTDEQQYGGMKQAGLPDTVAEGYTTMGKSLREGKMQGHYHEVNPAKNGKLKLEDFVHTFVAVYNAQ